MSRSVGVEEEFLLFAGDSARLVAAGDDLVSAATADSTGQFEHELTREQAELGTKPHHDLSELASELRLRRSELTGAAKERGIRLAALATCPVPAQSTMTPERRYARMRAIYGRVAQLQQTCGMHVHVEVGSKEEAIAVVDRLAPWLPVLLALSADSPYLAGEDTGYASYRTMQWGQWPTAGLLQPFGDVAGYDEACTALLASGAALDEAMLYFDARPSVRFPTVEIRVADVCPYLDDAVTLAGLCRVMVEAAAREWVEGKPSSAFRPEALRAARWRAARFGTSEDLYDVQRRRLTPAWTLVDELVDWVGDALDESGDRGAVTAGLERIRERGTGADLQREVYAGTGDLGAVVDAVVDVTAS